MTSIHTARMRRVVVGVSLALTAHACSAPQSSQIASAPAPAADTAAARRRNSADSALRNDWANLARYRADNARLGPPAAGEQRVVFYGNSITEGFAPRFPALFPGKPYVGRGISGQTTPQMLVRFRQDVVALNTSLVDKLKGAGLTFTDPDKQPFRDALKQAGFYTEWQKRFGDEPWALLEKYTGKL